MEFKTAKIILALYSEVDILGMKKYFILISFLAIFLLPNFSSAQTMEELKIQIAQLLKQIEELKAQLGQKEVVPSQWCYDFNINLKIGDSGGDIEAIRTVLKKEGFEFRDGGAKFDDEVASAVSGFQQKYGDEILAPLGLKYGTGYAGKATRAKLNQFYGCGVVLPAKPVPVLPQTPTTISTTEICKPSVICASGYALYNTGEKDSNNCAIKKCILTASLPVITGYGPGALQIGETGNFTVNARDQEQQLLTYSVNWGDGISSSYAPDFYTETATFSHSYNKAGIYNFSFIVTDKEGLSAKTGSSVKVSEVTVPLSISAVDYRNAYWQCYDGKESYEGGETSCKNSKIWKQYAEDFCMGRCRYDGKCGVNSFKFWNECGLLSTPAPTPTPTIPAQTTQIPAPTPTITEMSTTIPSSVPIQEIYEQVKCVFKGTAVKQECYGYTSVSGSNYSCSGIDSGIETCVVDVKGAKGEQVIWKSSCGGYAYTTTDGNNEYAEFACPTSNSTPTPTPTPIPTPAPAPIPSVNVLSPNYVGEEKWLIGNSYSIKWETPGYSQSLIARIILFNDKTGSEEIITDVGNTGFYVWTVPAVLGNMQIGEGFIYKIRVELLSVDSSKRIYDDSNVGHLGIIL